MEKKIKVAVMGATGAVGQVFMWMLSDHPWFVLHPQQGWGRNMHQQFIG